MSAAISLHLPLTGQGAFLCWRVFIVSCCGYLVVYRSSWDLFTCPSKLCCPVPVHSSLRHRSSTGCELLTPVAVPDIMSWNCQRHFVLMGSLFRSGQKLRDRVVYDRNLVMHAEHNIVSWWLYIHVCGRCCLCALRACVTWSAPAAGGQGRCHVTRRGWVSPVW